MLLQTKFTIMISVTLMMGVGFTMMMLKAIYAPSIILAVVLLRGEESYARAKLVHLLNVKAEQG